MAKRKMMIPEYGTVMLNGIEYYRTRIEDADGKLVALYARTPEELYNKETNALEQINNATFHRKSPTVAEYCEKWLLMQSVHVRATTLTDYTSKVRRHIIAELGDKRMGEVSLDDIQLALVPVSKKSASVYKSVVILYKHRRIKLWNCSVQNMRMALSIRSIFTVCVRPLKRSSFWTFFRTI